MNFSNFAQIIFSIVGGEKYNFTIDLLKAGLDAEGEEYIKSLKSDDSGKSRIRKFLSGINDITEIASDIINNYHQNLFVDYVIDTIDESLYPELCTKFAADPYYILIDVNDVPQRLSEIYEEILITAARGKSTIELNKQNTKIPAHHISKNVLSYTLTELEKKALIKLCELTNKAFYKLKNQVDNLLNKQYELMNLTDSEKDEKFKALLEKEIVSLKKSLDKSYSEIENLCIDTIKLLEPKKEIHASLGIIISIASNVISDKYNVKSLDKFNYNGFSLMIARFNNNYDKIRRDIDNL